MIQIAVVINPIAGDGAGKKAWRVLKPGLHALSDNIVFRMSNRVDDLPSITRDLLAGNPDYLLVIGGDGTLSNVLNGLMDHDKLIRPQTRLAFFNVGSGGDFARQFPKQNITEFLDRLSHNQFVTTNIGKITFINQPVRYFINIASCGISGYVVRATSKSKWLRKLGGAFNYLVHSIIAILAYNKSAVRIQIDDALPFECSMLLMAVCNGQYFGGSMHVAPMAKFDDGLFDVMLFQDFSKLDALFKIRKIYSGSHMQEPNVHYIQAKKVRIESLEKRSIRMEADGESVGILPATFEMLDDMVKIIV